MSSTPTVHLHDGLAYLQASRRDQVARIGVRSQLQVRVGRVGTRHVGRERPHAAEQRLLDMAHSLDRNAGRLDVRRRIADQRKAVLE